MSETTRPTTASTFGAFNSEPAEGYTQNLVCYLAEIRLPVTRFYSRVFVLLERIRNANKGTA